MMPLDDRIDVDRRRAAVAGRQAIDDMGGLLLPLIGRQQ